MSALDDDVAVELSEPPVLYEELLASGFDDPLDTDEYPAQSGGDVDVGP